MVSTLSSPFLHAVFPVGLALSPTRLPGGRYVVKAQGEVGERGEAEGGADCNGVPLGNHIKWCS